MGELYHVHQEAPGPRGTWEQAHNNAVGISPGRWAAVRIAVATWEVTLCHFMQKECDQAKLGGICI